MAPVVKGIGCNKQMDIHDTIFIGWHFLKEFYIKKVSLVTNCLIM